MPILLLSTLTIPDVSVVMADFGGERDGRRLARSIFTDRQVQTERQSENSSRGKQGNLFQKTLQGVSAKSHTILSAANVCVAFALQNKKIRTCLGASLKQNQIHKSSRSQAAPFNA